MNKKNNSSQRTFKTAWFAKAAKKARIDDEELSRAIQQVMQGQAIDLGGGVFKKRLNENNHRSIILARGGSYWVYEFLFAKKDLANIDDNDLINFKRLAKAYAGLSEEQINQLLKKKAIMEIYHENKT